MSTTIKNYFQGILCFAMYKPLSLRLLKNIKVGTIFWHVFELNLPKVKEFFGKLENLSESTVKVGVLNRRSEFEMTG